MPNVEASPITAPNEMLQSLASKRSMTPGSSGSPVNDPNSSISRGDPGSSGPRTRSGSPVTVPDHRFHVADAKMPQPPSAIEMGKGMIPVDPRARPMAAGMARRDTPKFR